MVKYQRQLQQRRLCFAYSLTTSPNSVKCDLRVQMSDPMGNVAHLSHHKEILNTYTMYKAVDVEAVGSFLRLYGICRNASSLWVLSLKSYMPLSLGNPVTASWEDRQDSLGPSFYLQTILSSCRAWFQKSSVNKDSVFVPLSFGLWYERCYFSHRDCEHLAFPCIWSLILSGDRKKGLLSALLINES